MSFWSNIMTLLRTIAITQGTHGNSNEDSRLPLEFIYNAINDSQDIIRAIDFKLSLLLLFLIIPLTSLSRVYNSIMSIKSLGTLSFGIFVFIMLLWLVSFIMAIIGIIGKTDPNAHIKREKAVKGTFYSGGLFDIGLSTILMNGKKCFSRVSLEKHLQEYPVTFPQLKEELIFEHMKVVYIRDMKMEQQKWAFFFASLWVLAGGFLWIIALVTNS